MGGLICQQRDQCVRGIIGNIIPSFCGPQASGLRYFQFCQLGPSRAGGHIWLCISFRKQR